jgi:NitT/TauT family transport system substrate-binding protein
MFRKIYLLTALLIVFGLVLQGCTGSPAVKTQTLPDIGPIKVGYLPILGHASLYIAQDKGYFKEQGLTVELQTFNSGANMIAPLSVGQLDVGSGETGTALLNAIAQGLDIKIVQGTGSMPKGHSGNPFLVRKDLYDSGEVTTFADLKGKKIAINAPRGMVEYLVSEVLAKGGLTVDDAELVVLPFPDMPVAFANKAIDAAILAQPMADKTIKDGYAVMLIGGDEIVDRMQISVMYFGKRLLDPANKEIGIRYMMALLKAVRDLQEDGYRDEENAAIISKYTQLPVPVIQNSVKSYSEPNGAINEKSLQDVQEYYISRGYVDYEQPMLFSQMMDPSFLEETLKRIGVFEEESFQD